jgi:molecular chaperone GrpE (heat shock protein)
MNDDFKTFTAESAEPITQGTSSIYRLFESFIALREKNERQHKLFEQTLNRTRDSFQASFNTFAAETQKAYQQLRQDILGEKKFSLNLLNELLDLAVESDHIVSARPVMNDQDPALEPIRRWSEAVEIQNRRVQQALKKFGIHPYDAVVGSNYNPSLHERVGTMRVDGMEALRIAEQKERGYASQQPDFILRRPKVVVTE